MLFSLCSFWLPFRFDVKQELHLFAKIMWTFVENYTSCFSIAFAQNPQLSTLTLCIALYPSLYQLQYFHWKCCFATFEHDHSHANPSFHSHSLHAVIFFKLLLLSSLVPYGEQKTYPHPGRNRRGITECARTRLSIY